MAEFKVVDSEGVDRIMGISNLPHALRMCHHMKSINSLLDYHVIDVRSGDVIEPGDLDGNLQVKTLNREIAAESVTHVPREASLVDTILKNLNAAEGVKAVKWHGSVMSRGNPDIFGCANGRMFLIEVKRPGGKPTAQQLRELQAWGLAGAVSCVMTEASDVAELLDHLKGQSE